MKKLLFVVTMCLVGTYSFGQTFSFGPKAGINVSNYSGGDINSDAKVGYHLGGMLNFGFCKIFCIQPEVLFSTQGAKVENAGSKKDFKINYLNIPIMVKFRIANRFYIEAGPQTGFRLSENIPDQTINSFATKLDLSAGAGLGYQSDAGIGVGLRYLAGLSKVGDFSGMEISPDFKNSVVQASVFWMIPIIKK
ncbi:porin family protein [Dyadobacter psychrotolerans]|uniref:PorT family protein n=1 Tax=Dyadobacter psychrotolerans TaxID=2541721 RepID=A0A4R5E0P5_9BACT|nr:porin family protein [Dyadobacter psychrotolerans]TDE18121.1 PorT family protein [Dyadobacter psychrotolerans]